MTSSTTVATTANAACAFQFLDSQGKNYEKTEFKLHSRVAELVGDQIGRVFYDDNNDDWLISPNQLRKLVLTNILQADEGDESRRLYSRYPIYGSAIAFEPGVWTKITGLEDGVTYPAASKACMEDAAHCTPKAASSWENLRLNELKLTMDGQTLYCPYAFRGPPDESVYENCSRDQPDFCPSMDLTHAYDYSNITLAENEWYTAPRCLYLRDGVRSGYWTSPYFDAGAGMINMVTYSQPISSRSGKFLGIVTVDVTVDALCYRDQCGTAVDYNYLTKIRPVGFTFVAIAFLCALWCGVWTQIHSRNRVVIASQPFFLRLICLGCLIMASSILPLSIDDSIASMDGCSKACMAFPWLLSIGFTATFSALFSKIWRLNKVFRNARHMRRVTVRVHDALWPFAILMTVNCALMVVWTLVDPLVWFRTEPDDAYESRGYCRAEGASYIVFLVLIVLVNASALVLANVQAFRARNISTEFSESLYIMMTMVSLLQALVIGGPLLVIVRENTVANYFVASGLIFVVTMAVLGLMFVPKMILVRQKSRDNGRESRVSITGHAMPGTPHQSNPTARNAAQVIPEPHPSRNNQGITRRHSNVKDEETPEVVVVFGAADGFVSDGNHSVMTGKF